MYAYLLRKYIHRKKGSKGHHIEVVPIILFSDDVSGNVSKKWNKFDVWAMMLAGLPRAINSHLSNIHFICASNLANCMQMSQPIVQDLLALENDGMLMYDAHLKEEVIVVAPVICGIADNPRASDFTSHLGLSARKYCRICEVCACAMQSVIRSIIHLSFRLTGI